jgi:hypothetical protein
LRVKCVVVDVAEKLSKLKVRKKGLIFGGFGWSENTLLVILVVEMVVFFVFWDGLMVIFVFGLGLKDLKFSIFFDGKFDHFLEIFKFLKSGVNASIEIF